MDGLIGEVLAAINARPQRAAEQWIIIVTTDHDGTGTSHGEQSAAERTIIVIANGPSFPAGKLTKDVTGHNCVPPTVFKVLGVATEPAWLWSGTEFGVERVHIRGEPGLLPFRGAG